MSVLRSMLLLIPLTIAIEFEDLEKPPVIETKFGSLAGTWTESYFLLRVATFLGIPYAEAPIGDLRFRDPRPWNETWNDVRDASVDAPPCLQLSEINDVIGSEDCLYLNVYVPTIRYPQYSTYKQPVLVFVHGLAFATGTSDSYSFPATYLADQQVILVTLNYRLGPLGFFALGNEVSPGNYGLKDILMALKWVRENIESFGGDRSSVTLMGHSAGAAAAHILALSKDTEDLFDKYILQSGSALATWAVQPRTVVRERSLGLASVLGCLGSANVTANITANETASELESKENCCNEESIEEDEETIGCMRSMEAEDVVREMFHVYPENTTYPFCMFGPTLEDESSSDAILTMHPMEMIEKQLFRDIPCIMGVVRDEGLVKILDILEDDERLNTFVANFDEFLPTLLNVQDVVSNISEFVTTVKDFYVANASDIRLQNVTYMAGDALITWPTYKAVKYQSQLMKSSLYFYYFAYFGTFSFTFKSGSLLPYGIDHGDDLNYLFPVLNNEFTFLSLHNTENDVTMINVMTELWTSFVRTGVPRALGTSPWPIYRERREFMLFEGLPHAFEQVLVRENHFLTISKRMEFWESLMANYSVASDESSDSPPEDLEQKESAGVSTTPKVVSLLGTLGTILMSMR